MPEEMELDRGALIFASLAEVYLDSGMIDEAISILKDGLIRNPTYNFGHFLLGKAYYLKNDFDTARQKFEEGVGLDPRMVSGYLYLGHIYRRQDDKIKACEYYQKVLELKPNDAEAKSLLEELMPPIKAETPPKAVIQEPPPTVAPPKFEKPPEVIIIPKEETFTEAPPKVEVPPVVEPPAIGEEPLTVALPIDEKIKPVVEEPKEEEAPPKPEPTPVLEAPQAAPEVTTEPLKQVAQVPIVEPPAAEISEITTPEEIPTKAQLDKLMAKLVNLASVKGAMVVTKDGLLVGNYLKDPRDAEENAALVASIYNEATSCFNFLEQGEFERGVVERKEETIYIFAAQDIILAVITKATTKPGLIFTYCGKIMDDIKRILE